MPLPLGDIGRAGKGVEDHVQSMQQYLCRNHSDERLKVEIAARHRSRLLTANQHSVSGGAECECWVWVGESASAGCGWGRVIELMNAIDLVCSWSRTGTARRPPSVGREL